MLPRNILVKFTVFLCLFQPAALLAQAEKAKKTITIDDYFTQADIFDLAQGENAVAYTEGRWQKSTDDRKTDLWIALTGRPEKDKNESKNRRLTFDRASYRSPK